ncbi:MAG TPA: hypothetical protein VFE45_02035 [Coriobacteriia bacterium]|nr:hypothetical protein [Coriobacteriia bacterium]
MSVVIIAGARQTYARRLQSSLDQLQETGEVVHLVTYGSSANLQLRGQHIAIPVPPATRLARAPRAIRVVLRVLNLLLSRRATDRFRRAVLSSPDIDSLLRDADLLVAVDPPAVDVAWHLIRRHRDLAAVSGTPAALDVINRRRRSSG